MKNSILFILIMMCSCKNNAQELKTAQAVDVDKYIGKWYEIARMPNSFENQCECVTAEYSKCGGYIKVVNACTKNGKPKRIEGKAFVVKNSNNAKFKVQFFWLFKGNYWILDVGIKYEYAIVGEPDRKYAWILCRTPFMDSVLYEKLVDELKSNGYSTYKLLVVKQK